MSQKDEGPPRLSLPVDTDMYWFEYKTLNLENPGNFLYYNF